MSNLLDVYDLTSSQSLFLFVLFSNPDKSASEIVDKLEKRLGNEVVPTPGARYKILKKLEDKGLIEETTEIEQRKDKRKRTYKITKEGSKAVKVQIERMEAMFYFITECCSGYFKNQNVVKIILNDSDCC